MSGLDSKFSKALVTGASSGLGKAIVEALLAEGVEVWGTSRDLERLPKMDKFHGVILELEDGEALTEWFLELDKEVGAFDLLVNNAGFASLGAFETISDSDLHGQLMVLLKAPMALTRGALFQMRERKRGTIVNVSSVVEQLQVPYLATYNAAKAGLSGFSRSLMLESPKQEPWIIDFCPGDLNTRFNTSFRQADSCDDSLSVYREKLDEMLAKAPSPESAAKDLLRALKRGGHGVIRSGSFFQSFIAPLFVRFIPIRFKNWLIRRYFKIT